MELLKAFFSVIWPRRLKNESDEGFQWRQGIAVAIFMLAGGLGMQTFLAWGLTPFLFSGFVTTAQLSSVIDTHMSKIENVVKKSTDDIKAQMVVDQLFNNRASQCAAIHSNNMALAETIGKQIEQGRQEYYAITGMIWEIRPCQEF